MSSIEIADNRVLEKAIRRTPGRYDFTKDTPIEVIHDRLIETRKTSRIHRTAKTIKTLLERGENVSFTPSERLRLTNAINKARHAEHILMPSFPRGYHIAQLLSVAKSLIPDFNSSPTRRDYKLIRLAAKQIKKDKRLDRKHLINLIEAAKNIGIEIHHV